MRRCLGYLTSVTGATPFPNVTFHVRPDETVGSGLDRGTRTGVRQGMDRVKDDPAEVERNERSRPVFRDITQYFRAVQLNCFELERRLTLSERL